jgi:RpiR family transcriptional regulator, carbohydrate utilization regulator
METSVIYAIKTNYSEMNGTEKKIADYIIKNPIAAVAPSIGKLSEEIGVSDATMFRFVKNLGFSGYPQFRICLARETTPIDPVPARQGLDSVDAALESARNALKETFTASTHESVKMAGKMLLACKRLFVAGMGGSGIIAEDFYHRFISTGLDCHYAEDLHTQLILAAQSKKDDVCVLFCHTGIDIDAISIAKEYYLHECPIIVITCNNRVPINKYATLSIFVLSTMPSPIVETYSERVASMILCDAIYIEVMSSANKSCIDAVNSVRRVLDTRRF